MNGEIEGLFENVEAEIVEGIDDERIRFIALMVNDLARNTCRMSSAGAINPAIMESLLAHSNAVMCVIVAADAVALLEDLYAIRDSQPDPMVEVLGYDEPGTAN